MSHTQKRNQSHKNTHKGKTKERITQTISVFGKGEGLVVVNGKEYRVYPEDLNTALDGDTVALELQERKNNPKAKVVKIEKRKRTKFVGTVKKESGSLIVSPDSRRMYTPLFIEDKNSIPEEGTKVAVQISEWKGGKPYGKIITVFGKQNEHKTEISSILFEHDIDTNFPPNVTAEGESFEKAWESILIHELEVRKDLRTTPTITIDPVDAKDFDDALSLTTLPNGNIEVGVHIADVSHFVLPDSALDKEASIRAFSVYLVDRTIPMLPESLSNNLCSLKPNEDRLAFSCLFELDSENRVVNEWFGKTVIHSEHRFSYEEAQSSIENGDQPLHDMLTIFNTRAKKMQAERSKEGSIDFGDSEVRFELDENGAVVDIHKKTRMDAHRLVEEYMLLANRRVARFMEKFTEVNDTGNIPLYFLYRIHDNPHAERMETFAQFVRALGYTFPDASKVSANDITTLLHKAKDTPESGVINTAALRTMSKAIYSTKNIGHFGLAFDTYTHFTSPIRRYADLIVHRLLQHALDNTKPEQSFIKKLPKLSEYICERELDVVDAERQSIRFKQVEYMQRHVGEVRKGIINGITEWGMYVEDSETKTEGLISIRSMKDDYYSLDKKSYALVGRDNKQQYQLGDEVAFLVKAVRLEERQIDFELKK
ncbi:MAG: ribonuclease R [Candidatus Paceibacterota bacterium]